MNPECSTHKWSMECKPASLLYQMSDFLAMDCALFLSIKFLFIFKEFLCETDLDQPKCVIFYLKNFVCLCIVVLIQPLGIRGSIGLK